MILFFKTPSKSVIAVECDHVLSQADIDKLCWLFGEATPESEDNLKGHFVGPRREMITPWSTNAVEITQNMGLNGITRIEEYFAVEKKGQSPYRPTEKGTFGMYLENEWYSLSAKDEIKSEDAVEGLDVSLLQNDLLDPILGIMDPKTDKRIDFVGGIRGLGELERRVHTDMKVAFSMYPTSIAELFAVADAGRLMPPKSTWFEPKLRSGLFLHEIER